MTLREVTRTVIKLVEDASGCPVVVTEDRSLTTLAASRIARGADKIHSISFNPSAVSAASKRDRLLKFLIRDLLSLRKKQDSSRSNPNRP